MMNYKYKVRKEVVHTIKLFNNIDCLDANDKNSLVYTFVINDIQFFNRQHSTFIYNYEYLCR
jgi:hypothetical protein